MKKSTLKSMTALVLSASLLAGIVPSASALTIKPAPPIVKPAPEVKVSIAGKLSVSGPYIKLQSGSKTFLLKGNVSGITRYNGKNVRVNGSYLYNGSAAPTTIIVSSYRLEEAKIQTLTGKLSTVNARPTLNVSGKNYNLVGRTAGLERLVNATVVVTGTATTPTTFTIQRYEVIQRDLTGGIVVENGKAYLLGQDGKKYLLQGNISGLLKLNRAVVRVTGSDYKKIKIPESNIFTVRSFQVLVPPVPVVEKQIMTFGTLQYVNIEGGAFVLYSREGKYVLVGDKAKFKTLVGKKVIVRGYTSPDVSTTTMSGKPLVVKTIEEDHIAYPTAK